MEGCWSRQGSPDTAEQLRAVVWELLRDREYGRAATLLETCRVGAKEEVRSLWYEVQYMKLKEQLGKNKLTAVQRFRCRKSTSPRGNILVTQLGPAPSNDPFSSSPSCGYTASLTRRSCSAQTSQSRFTSSSPAPCPFRPVLPQFGANGLSLSFLGRRNPPPRSLRPEESKTRTLPPEARQHLKAWARGNSANPSVAEREELAKETGLSKQQICNWFANYRRKLKKASRQQECVRELNQTQTSPRGSAGSPQTTVRGSRRLHGSGNCVSATSATRNNTAADSEWIKGEQASSQQTIVADCTDATRPGPSNPPCRCLGPPFHHHSLPETHPAALLNAASSSCYRPTEAASTLPQPSVALCPCLSMAVNLAQTPPLMVTSQPSFPNALFRKAFWASGRIERAATLEHVYSTEELLPRGNSAQMSPDNTSPLHSFSNLFLTNRQQMDTGEHLREEVVNDGYLCMMYPDVADVSQMQLEWSIERDSSWTRVSPNVASCCLAPLLDGRYLVPGGVGEPEGGAAVTGHTPLAVAGDEAGSCRGGLNQPSSWTLGPHSEDSSPQSNVEGVQIDYRRLTYVKVEAEVWCPPARSQVQRDTKLDMAAQALIQLSQRPTGGPSGQDVTASTACQKPWES